MEPGSSYSYNNAGYNTVGAIIEVASGMPLEDFLRARIYDPLGMADTLNHEDETKLHRMATVYRGRRGDDGGVVFRQGFTPGDPPDFPVVRASGRDDLHRPRLRPLPADVPETAGGTPTRRSSPRTR